MQYELPLFLNHFEGAEESPATPQASAAELLTSIVGKNQAENLLSRYHTLTDLAKTSVYELHEVPGVGKSKAAAIKAAFLLAQKLSEEQTPESALLDTPERVADLLREQNRLYDVEQFQVVLVNTRKRLIEVQNVSQGTLDTLLVHPREVFAHAITRKAAALILLHNHPSGDPTPSEADIKVTRDLIRGGQLEGPLREVRAAAPPLLEMLAFGPSVSPLCPLGVRRRSVKECFIPECSAMPVGPTPSELAQGTLLGAYWETVRENRASSLKRPKRNL